MSRSSFPRSCLTQPFPFQQMQNPPPPPVTATTLTPLLSAQLLVRQKIPLALRSEYAPNPLTSQASVFAATGSGLSHISPNQPRLRGLLTHPCNHPCPLRSVTACDCCYPIPRAYRLRGRNHTHWGVSPWRWIRSLGLAARSLQGPARLQTRSRQFSSPVAASSTQFLVASVLDGCWLESPPAPG